MGKSGGGKIRQIQHGAKGTLSGKKKIQIGIGPQKLSADLFLF
jgi:hypothetical protein